MHFQGDWGQANLHRVFGWLSQELWDRTPRGSDFVIHTGRGGAGACRAVARGEVDLAMTVPAAFAPAALDGTGPYEGTPFPNLRALAVIPQDDRLVLAVRKDLGIERLDQLRASEKLVISTSPDDGENPIGYAVTRVLEAAGMERNALTLVERERPDQVIEEVLAGNANAVFHEAVMAPWWRTLAEKVPLTFVPFSDAVLSSLESELGWPRGVLAAGYLPGMDEQLVTLDFSDFLMVCRDDLDDAVVRLITWCLVNTRENLERFYRHRPPERSGITWPLQPSAMRKTTIPLHAAAAACYDEMGIS